ncbi:MAG: hypothetical protein OXT09_13450 [Myxococcales bacterium]|nr:hypothetical protein [Myxococcales bacterium]
MDELETCSDVREFFDDHVSRAMQVLGVQAADDTKHYLIELLSDFSVSDRIQALERPLVEQLQAAQEAAGQERLSRLRDLGDVALFVAGFFPDSFERRGLTRSYVVAMGGRAYLVVGEAAHARGLGGRGRVFVELSARFPQLARVLDEVREGTSLCTEGEIVALYERWRRTGSPELARRLHRRGVAPHPGGDPGSGTLH